MRFVVVLGPDHDAGGFNVSVPALAGCFTQADTVEESRIRATDAIMAYLDGETEASLRAAGVDPNLIVEVVEVETVIPA